MTPEAWGFFSLLTTTSAATLIELVRTRKKVGAVDTKVDVVDTKVDVAAVEATKAAEMAAPTGNGFAHRTEGALGEILAKLGPIETKIERIGAIEAKLDGHIADHAANDVRRSK